VSTQLVPLHHQVMGPEAAPAVFLGPSLGTTLSMWDAQAAVFAEKYRVVRFDTRGHGGSPVPDGPYSVAQLAGDVIALADSLGIDTFAYVGLSLGGVVGQAIAVTHPDRLRALTLCCTGPSFGDPAAWYERAATVRSEGMAWLVEPTKERWFTPHFVQAHPGETQRLLDMIASASPEGYAGCCDALAACDMGPRLGEITAPTRVIAGAHDPVSPPPVAQTLVEGIADSDLVVLEDASHIANVAQPDEFNSAVLEHLEKHR